LHHLLWTSSTSRASAAPYLPPQQCHLSLQARDPLSELALQPLLPQTVLALLLVPKPIVQLIHPSLKASNKRIQVRGRLKASGCEGRKHVKEGGHQGLLVGIPWWVGGCCLRVERATLVLRAEQLFMAHIEGTLFLFDETAVCEVRRV
jgi:hypothetical protein